MMTWRVEKPESPRGIGGFIVFEGIDGSGKSTQALMLMEKLKSLGIPSILTAEPSDGPAGRMIRSMTVRPDPEEEVRLFTADRQHHVERVIRPALAAGTSVVCDRYVFSSVAYQGARGVDPHAIMSLNSPFAVRPDVILLLEVDIDVAMSRISSGRAGAYSPFEVRAGLSAVDRIYRELTDPLIRRVEGSLGPKKVHRSILNILSDLEPFQFLKG